MMQQWVDQEEQKRDRFPRRDDNNGRRNGDQRLDRGQLNFDKKHKLEDTVTAMDRNHRGKKTEGQQDHFKKILHKQCPLHPRSKHTIFQCINLRKSLNAPPLDEDKRKKGKQDDEE
jgi:hypothetical protein